jgi:hypothetical protein
MSLVSSCVASRWTTSSVTLPSRPRGRAW